MHAIPDCNDALKANRGSEQYQAMNWSMAYSYTRREGGEPRLLSTRQFAMIQIWKSKHSATVIRLDSVFAHGDGLPCRRIGTTANRLGDASIRRAWIGRVLSAIACLRQ